MDLMEFVANISLEAFEDLRKAVVARHRYHSTKIVEIMEYIKENDHLVKLARTDRDLCEKTVVEETGAPISFATKSINRFLEVDEMKSKVEELNEKEN